MDKIAIETGVEKTYYLEEKPLQAALMLNTYYERNTSMYCFEESVAYVHMWQSQVENKHYSTVSGLIRLVISLECFIEITPDFLCPFMND